MSESLTTPSLGAGAVVVESPRLAIREMGPADLPFVAAMLADPEVMHLYPRVYTRRESEDWIAARRRSYRRHGYGFWLAVDRRTGDPIGQIGLNPPRVDGVPEADLGYLIHRPYWGLGYATEGAAAVLAHAFAALDLPRVVCLIRPWHRASHRVARRIGMARDPGRIASLVGFDHWVFAADRPGPHLGTNLLNPPG